MGEAIFIRAAASCGYEKADVDKRLEQLYGNIYDLKNQLRENKLVIQKLENGESLEKSIENALGAERAAMTQIQVKNENLTEKYKSAKDRAEKAEKENEELRARLEAVEKELEESKTTITALRSADNAAGLSFLFSEAQKSAELLRSNAQKECDEIRGETQKFVDNLIAETNDKAAMIIYDAQVQAADLKAEAENLSEQMNISSNNLRAVMLHDVDKLSGEIQKIKDVLLELEKSSIASLDDTNALLGLTREELTEGGIPVFSDPAVIEPEYPEMPVKTAVPEPEEPPKSKMDLNKLQAMAEAIGSEAPKDEPAPEEDKPVEAAPEAEAPAPEPEAPESEPEDDEPIADGDPDLMKLMAQAQAIGGNDEPVKKPAEDKKDPPKKKIDLAELAKQAAAIDQ